MSLLQPDRVFVQRLKEMDSRLGCRFDREFERFVITYKRAIGEDFPILFIEDDNGGFRHPDQRDLNTLCESDTHRVSAKERFQAASKYMEEYRRHQRRAAKDNIRGWSRDDKIQLSNAFNRIMGAGKGNSAFRRVNPKSRGTVFA